MGRLFTPGSFDAMWVYETPHWDGRKQGWSGELGTDYPHMVAVPHYYLTSTTYYERSDDKLISRVTLRRYIERDLSGDAVATDRNMSYRYVPDYYMGPDGEKKPEYRWKSDYEISRKVAHGYLVFHFELQADALAFRLRFPEFTTTELDKLRPDQYDLSPSEMKSHHRSD